MLGILAFLDPMALCGLPACVIGRAEIRQIDACMSPRGGRSIALIGMILGIITTVFSALMVAICLALFPLMVRVVEMTTRW